MRRGIALQKHCVRKFFITLVSRNFGSARASSRRFCRAVASAVPSGFCCGGKRSCAEDSARYSFAAARIFRARSTTISDVTCFMQA